MYSTRPGASGLFCDSQLEIRLTSTPRVSKRTHVHTAMHVMEAEASGNSVGSRPEISLLFWLVLSCRMGNNVDSLRRRLISPPSIYGTKSSWARDQTCTTVATQAVAMTMLDP